MVSQSLLDIGIQCSIQYTEELFPYSWYHIDQHPDTSGPLRCPLFLTHLHYWYLFKLYSQLVFIVDIIFLYEPVSSVFLLSLLRASLFAFIAFHVFFNLIYNFLIVWWKMSETFNIFHFRSSLNHSATDNMTH